MEFQTYANAWWCVHSSRRKKSCSFGIIQALYDLVQASPFFFVSISAKSPKRNRFKWELKWVISNVNKQRNISIPQLMSFKAVVAHILFRCLGLIIVHRRELLYVLFCLADFHSFSLKRKRIRSSRFLPSNHRCVVNWIAHFSVGNIELK